MRQRVVLHARASHRVDQLGGGARGALLGGCRDPALRAIQSALERGDLGARAAVIGTLHGSPGLLASNTSIFTPKRSRRRARSSACLEQTPGVDRQDRTARPVPWSSRKLVEQHRLLLLEGAQQHGALAVARASRSVCVRLGAGSKCDVVGAIGLSSGVI